VTLALTVPDDAAGRTPLSPEERRAGYWGFDGERLSLALSAGGLVGLWDGDLKTGKVYGDANFARLYGLDPQSVAAGMPRGAYSEYMHPDDLEVVRADIDRMFAGADEYFNEHRIFHPTEGLRWVLTRGHLVRDADGEPAHFSGVSVNITQRKQAEARQAFLLTLSDRLRGLDDPQAILDTAVALLGAHLGANRVGYGQVQADDVSIEMEASYTDGVAAIRGRFQMSDFGPHNVALARQGVTVVTEDVLADPHCAPETWAAIETRALVCAPMLRNGRMTAALYVNSRAPRVWDPADVRLIEEVAARLWEAMERSRADAAVRVLNDKLEQIVEQRTREADRTWRLSPVVMLVADRSGVLLQANPAWTRCVGWSLEESRGRDIMEFLAPEDHEAGVRGMAQLAHGEPVTDFKLTFLARDGGRRILDWTTMPDGDRLHGFGRDITELTMAEEHLRQAQKMEALGQLTGGIAHDFNNLLQGVAGSLDLIRRRPSDEASVLRWAEAGLSAAERGARLTSQLLAFSRVQVLELASVRVAELVENMRDLLERTLGPRVRIQLKLDARSLAARCDATQLEMAILNLAINARDAMSGQGDLAIEVREATLCGDPALPDGAYLEVSVRDTGAGMPPEVAARAFDPFFTTKESGKGTGLGLSQVYGSASKAGGTARIESRPGQGTTVRILLPRAAAEAPAAAAERPPPPAIHPRSETVLVVDDDPAVRGFLAASLDSLGFRTVEAGDGPAGLAALDDLSPDLMILDFAMPGLTGVELAGAARALKPDFPIIFASGYSDTAAISEIPGPPIQLLRKPFRVDDLARVLDLALTAPPPD
jgi:PAS domain S-box-containing protein